MGTKKPEMAPSQPTEYPNLVSTERLPHEIESLAKRALLNPDHDFTANTRAMMNSGQQVRAVTHFMFINYRPHRVLKLA